MQVFDICDIANAAAVASSIIRFTTLTEATRNAQCICNGSLLRISFAARVQYGRATFTAKVERVHNTLGDPFSPSWAEENIETVLAETLWEGTYDAFHTGAVDIPSFIARIEAAVSEDVSEEPEADISLDSWRDKEHENA